MYGMYKKMKKGIALCPSCKSSYYVKYVKEEESYYCSKCKKYFMPIVDLGGSNIRLPSSRGSKYNILIDNKKLKVGLKKGLEIRGVKIVTHKYMK